VTPITWQAAVDDEEQRPLLQDIFEAAVDGHHGHHSLEQGCVLRRFQEQSMKLLWEFSPTINEVLEDCILLVVSGNKVI